jgi:hypothetical protein
VQPAPFSVSPPFIILFIESTKAVKVDCIAFSGSMRQNKNGKFRFWIQIKRIAAPHQTVAYQSAKCRILLFIWRGCLCQEQSGTKSKFLIKFDSLSDDVIRLAG